MSHNWLQVCIQASHWSTGQAISVVQLILGYLTIPICHVNNMNSVKFNEELNKMKSTT